MKTTIRAYLPAGGACARRTALRLFLMYGIRPRLISRQISPADRLYPFWRLTSLPRLYPTICLPKRFLKPPAPSRMTVWRCFTGVMIRYCRITVLFWSPPLFSAAPTALHIHLT